MGIGILFIYLVFSIILLCKKKSIYRISLFYLIIAPPLKYNSASIDSMYVVIIYLVFLMILSRKKIRLKKNYISYFVVILFNLILYLLMTLIFSSNIGSVLESVLGMLKLPALMILICSLFNNEVNKEENYDAVFKSALLVNLIGVIIQSVFGVKVRPFFEELYLTNNNGYYSTLSDGMVYNRKFGFFTSPMLLGVFCAFCAIYFLCRYSKTKNTKFIFYLIIAIITGITSLSKSFILGMPIIIISFIILKMILNEKEIKISKKSIKKMIVLIMICPILYMFIFKFYTYMSENSTIDYYLKMITNPIRALESRYNTASSDEILLAKTYDIINKHFWLGVGLQSIDGEFLGDSSYILALHNGGVISLFTIIIFYFFSIIKAIKKREVEKIVFLIFWIISGLGMTTFFNVLMVLPFYLYFFNIDNMKEKNCKGEV